MKELHLLLLYADRSDNLDDSSDGNVFYDSIFSTIFFYDNRDNIDNKG